MRFYLHQTNGADRIDDLEGEDFADLEAACDEAVLGARHLMSETIRIHGRLGLGRAFEITDEFGTVVATMAFAQALQIV